ncbi:MAG: aminotransferase class I/II-fold pyridoxal phosphate-dependent enzyme [Chlamydiia bacterium]|nr:aminotransferase class I/II-fold pyridoxal phosphate-dependent enzyme [Chlamydiia bacterium]
MSIVKDSPRATDVVFAERTARLATENAFKVGPHIAAVEAAGKPVVRLNLGEPDFNIPQWIKDEVKHQVDECNNTHYCDPKGILSFRKAIAEKAGELRGLDIDPECVAVFPGAKPSIGFSQMIYCNPGDEVIYPTPGFPIYESFVRYVGATPVPFRLEEETGFEFTAARLEELLTDKTRLIFLNFPSNPTGRVTSKAELEKIAEVIQRKGSPHLRVYSDEIYEHILYDGLEHFSIASLPGMAERTLISSGLSKTFAWTGGRLGYIILPTRREATMFTQYNINFFSCVPPFLQEAGRVALTHPDTPGAVHSMVSTFQQRRDVIWQMLNAIDGVSCLKPQGAFYLFPNVAGALDKLGAIRAFERLPEQIQAHTSPSTLLQMFALYKHGVAVMDRRSFGSLQSQGQHYLRLSIAADLEKLKEGVRRLDPACKDRDGFQNFVREGKHLF